MELYRSCVESNSIEALKYINYYETEVNYVDPETGRTPLIAACLYKLPEVAMALINDASVDLEVVDKFSMTALKAASLGNPKKMKDVIRHLISFTPETVGDATELSDEIKEKYPSQQQFGFDTALLNLVSNASMYPTAVTLALELIATGKSNPNHIDSRTRTYYAKDNHNTIIYEPTSWTALILACRECQTEIALALIATGESTPDHINSVGDTALIWACRNRLSEVVDALCNTDNYNPEQVNSQGETAQSICKKLGFKQ